MSKVLRVLFVMSMFFPVTAFCLDYESKIPHDKVCVVEAISSNGDVYLQCKDTKSVLKTSVELPASVNFEYTLNTKEAIERGKKLAAIKTTWAMLDVSFSNRSYILLNFNSEQTLITGASMYTGGGGARNEKKKLDL